jgi:hypothetical protein
LLGIAFCVPADPEFSRFGQDEAAAFSFAPTIQSGIRRRAFSERPISSSDLSVGWTSSDLAKRCYQGTFFFLCSVPRPVTGIRFKDGRAVLSKIKQDLELRVPGQNVMEYNVWDVGKRKRCALGNQADRCATMPSAVRCSLKR